MVICTDSDWFSTTLLILQVYHKPQWPLTDDCTDKNLN